MGGRTGRSRNATMKRLIKKYLPKASRGGQRRLIARAKSSRSAKGSMTVASIKKRSIAKKASKRIATRVNTAHAVKSPTTKDVIAIKKKIIALAAASRPTPVLRKSLSLKTKRKLDVTTTAGIKKSEKRKGWQIQIAASDDRSKALAILKKVKKRNKSLLSAASAFTQKNRSQGQDIVSRSVQRFPFSKISQPCL